MKKSATIVSAALVLVATVWAGTIRFDPMHGLVEVDVVIDGHAKGRFGIDTGADLFYIDRGWAKRNQINVTDGPPQRGAVSVGGESGARMVPVRSLEIGDERLYNLTGVAIDMAALVANPKATPPDGLIGYDLLRRFFVTVDYPNRQMTLQSSQPDFLGRGGYETVPFEIAHHLIIVSVTIDDSVTVPMALDYCATHVLISPSLAARLGFDADAEQVTIPKVSMGGKITTEQVAAGIDDLSALRNRLGEDAFEGLIGGSFLYPHKITIDYGRDRIYLHR